MSLVRTFYTSQSTIAPDAIGEEVARIIQTSVRNNRAAKLTGLLLTHEGWFLQALEGPDRAVEATLDQIRRDRRHQGVKVLQRSEVRDRMFGEWNMCARTLNQVDAAILATLDARQIKLASIGASAAERLLLVVRNVRGAAAERLLNSSAASHA